MRMKHSGNGSTGSGCHQWNLVVAGCGTAGLAVACAVAHGAAAPSLKSATLIDCDVVEQHNRITCPEYAGYEGEPKASVLAGLLRQWLPGRVELRVLCRPVEQVDWADVLAPCNGAARPNAEPLTLIVMALDDWQSRLCVVEDVRLVANGKTSLGEGEFMTVPVIQVAVDRDQAQVSVFGSRWDDPCPACGLAALPQPEPCVLLGSDGRSLRGDLQREAKCAARLVVEIIHTAVHGNGLDRWLNTKTNLVAIGPGGRRYRRYSRPRQPVRSCLGPHSPARPLHAEELLEDLLPEEPNHVCKTVR